MHLYYDHTLYSFPLYTFLWPEDGPRWPKHVVISIINRIQDRCVLTYPTPSLIAYNTTGMMHLKISIGCFIYSQGHLKHNRERKERESVFRDMSSYSLKSKIKLNTYSCHHKSLQQHIHCTQHKWFYAFTGMKLYHLVEGWMQLKRKTNLCLKPCKLPSWKQI